MAEKTKTATGSGTSVAVVRGKVRASGVAPKAAIPLIRALVYAHHYDERAAQQKRASQGQPVTLPLLLQNQTQFNRRQTYLDPLDRW